MFRFMYFTFSIVNIFSLHAAVQSLAALPAEYTVSTALGVYSIIVNNFLISLVIF